MARRNQHSADQLREMAIEAAITLLEEKGAEALSMRNIAREIGYTVGTLYHIFGNRDDLLYHLHVQTLMALNLRLQKIPLDGRSLRDIMLDYARVLLTFAAKHPGLWQALMQHHSHAESTALEEYRHQLNLLLQQLAAPILTHDAAQAQTLARMVWAGVHGISSLGQSQKLGVSKADEIALLIVSFIDTLLKGRGLL